MPMYVCKTYDQFRQFFQSTSRPSILHVVTFDRYLQKLVCSCEGFHNHGHCKHIQEVKPPCDWMGDSPEYRNGRTYCPQCGELVYELQNTYSQVISEQRSIDDIDTCIDIDRMIMTSGDLTVVRNDDTIYIIDSSQKDAITQAFFDNINSLSSAPSLSLEKVERLVSLLEEILL